MQFKNMKFRVRDEEHSKQIQEALFELGYRWPIYGTEVIHTAAVYLCASQTGELDWSVMESSFLNQAFPEYELKFKPEFVEVVKEEVVELNGKLYNKKQLEEALSKLKPIQENH